MGEIVDLGGVFLRGAVKKQESYSGMKFTGINEGESYGFAVLYGVLCVYFMHTTRMQ